MFRKLRQTNCYPKVPIQLYNSEWLHMFIHKQYKHKQVNF